MSNKIFDSQTIDCILPYIVKFIERHEINIVKLSKACRINRKTLYNNLYGDKKINLKFLSKICKGLNIEMKISLAIK